MREFLLHITCWLFIYIFLSIFFIWGVSLTHPALALFFCGEFLLHIPACLIFLWGVSLTHPVLASYLCGEFLLNVRYWLCFYLGSLSYTSRACFLFLWGVCLTHPELVLPPPPPPPPAGFIFYAGSFLHPVLAFNSFIYIWEFLLHIPRWLYFSVGSFSYTYHACLMFLWGVSLTHPMMAFFF